MVGLHSMRSYVKMTRLSYITFLISAIVSFIFAYFTSLWKFPLVSNLFIVGGCISLMCSRAASLHHGSFTLPKQTKDQQRKLAFLKAYAEFDLQDVLLNTSKQKLIFAYDKWKEQLLQESEFNFVLDEFMESLLGVELRIMLSKRKEDQRTSLFKAASNLGNVLQ